MRHRRRGGGLVHRGRRDRPSAQPAHHAARHPRAGDVWHGAFALALAEGRPEREAVAFASAAAALKCIKGGGWGSIPDRAATDAFLKHGEAR
jgi:sulfofructose kinase